VQTLTVFEISGTHGVVNPHHGRQEANVTQPVSEEGSNGVLDGFSPVVEVRNEQCRAETHEFPTDKNDVETPGKHRELYSESK
jgi:hypothetical protein